MWGRWELDCLFELRWWCSFHSEIGKYNLMSSFRCHAVWTTHSCSPLMEWLCGHSEMGIMGNWELVLRQRNSTLRWDEGLYSRILKRKQSIRVTTWLWETPILACYSLYCIHGVMYLFSDLNQVLLFNIDTILSLPVHHFRKWSSFATGGSRRSVAGLSSPWRWPVMDTFTHLDKVRLRLLRRLQRFLRTSKLCSFF